MRIDNLTSREGLERTPSAEKRLQDSFETLLRKTNSPPDGRPSGPNTGNVFAASPDSSAPFFSSGPATPSSPKDNEQIRKAVEATGDQAAIKALDDPNLADISNTGVPLANIASITKVSDNVLDLKTRDGHDIVILKQATPYLFDGMSSKTDAVNSINDSLSAGYKLAGAGDNAPGLGSYTAIGPADEVGPGLIRYETQSGEKVIVSREVNPNLYNQVKSDGETLGVINDSEKQGYHLAGPNEAAGMQIVGTPEELGHGLIRYETASGDKVIASRDISPDLYDQAVKFSAGVTGAAGAADTNFIDNSKYSHASDWDSITGNKGGPATQEEKDLDRPRAAAEMLADNWQAWGLHDRKIDFANPPTDLPPEAQAALKYVSSSPSLMAALDCGGYGKTDGVITQNDVKSFVNQADKDLSAASSSYGKFLKNHPDATPLAKESAKSAAIVMANISLVSSAGPEMQGDSRRDSVGNLDASNLGAIANDPGLSKSLTGAAGYWSSPGMLRTLDVAGDSPATFKADGITQQQNIGTWLEKLAPASDDGVLSMLNNAALRNSVADVDTSKLTADVLAHPENYDAKTKTAVMLQLIDTRTRLTLSGNSISGADLYSKYTAPQRGLNPNKDKVESQLDAAINQLSSDDGVKSFMAQNQKSGMQAIVNSDPGFKAALQNYQDSEINSGDILNKAFAMKNADGKPLPLGDALRLAANNASLTNLALGGDGNVDLAAIAEKSGKTGDIEQYFHDHVVSGQDLQAAIAKAQQDGVDPVSAIQNFAADAAAYKAFLGDKISSDDAAAVETQVTEALSETLVGAAGGDVMKQMFGDANGNFDEAKATDVITKAAQADPDMFKTADGATIKPADVVSMIRSMWDIGRQNDKIGDTLPKVIDGLKLNVSDAYKQGLLHIGSAVLAGGVLIARSATGGNSPTEDASRVAAGLQFAGLLMEGGTKYAKTAGYGIEWKVTNGVNGAPGTIDISGKGPLTAQDIKDLGNIGKLIGGAGSFIGGVLGLIGGVNSAFSGDPLGATISLTSGTLGTGAAIASLIEGGAGLFGLEDIAAVAGVASGLLGDAAAIFGGIASVALPLALANEEGKEEDAFYGQLVPILQQYGLTGGPEEPGDYPPDPIPAINT